MEEEERSPFTANVYPKGWRNQDRIKANIDRRWHKDAACLDSYDVFSNSFDQFRVATAERINRDCITICAGCPVRLDCLRVAIVDSEAFGVWGGMTYKERVLFTAYIEEILTPKEIEEMDTKTCERLLEQWDEFGVHRARYLAY